MTGRHFAPGLLLLAFIVSACLVQGTTSQTTAPSPCNALGCICKPSDPSRDPGANALGLDVTCHVRVMSNKSKVIRSLPPAGIIRSLTLICGTHSFYSHLEQGLLGKFSQIWYLTIRGCFIKTVQPEFLSSFDNLQELALLGVTLDPLQPKFQSKTLKSLEIADGKFNGFPDFLRIPSLEKLTIVNNSVLDSRMTLLDFNYFELNRLTDLSLVNNTISSIPSAMFSSMPSLVNLFISKNRIKQLSFPLNGTLPDMEIIDALENPLEIIDSNVMTSFTKLRVLKMQGTGKPLEVKFLDRLQKLAELRLSNFKLNSSIWDFLRSSSLERLDLSGNQLTSFNLNSLPTLRLLRLQENSITQLLPESFFNQTQLQLVNLTDNQISFLPESVFRNNHDIKAVLLSSNNFEHIPENIFSLNKELFYFAIGSNRIRSVPNKIFMGLNKLLYVYLENNKLENFPVFPSPCALRSLCISNNSLTSLTKSHVQNLQNLELLEADHNLIRELPGDVFSACPKLISASLKYNQIRLAGSFEWHYRLQILMLENNQIQHCPSFSKLRDLRILFLDNNDIAKIERNTFPSSMRAISLSNNNISYISRADFSFLPSLEYVNLMRNKKVLKINPASVSVFSRNTVKPVFFLGFSVLHCDCNMGFLKAWSIENAQNHLTNVFSKYYPTFVGLEHAYCESYYFPGTERPFLEVPLDHFVCNNTDGGYCDPFCDCCENGTSCPCYARCPDKCDCYNGGSAFMALFYSVKCDNRGLTRIPSDIYPQTTQLLLDGNTFDAIDSSFSYLTFVQELNLNGSSISMIEDRVFEGMTSLRVLRLNENKLLRIGKNTFGNISSLFRLYLNENKIRTIDVSAFDGLTSLTNLYLNGNDLLALNPVLDLPSLKVVTLANNPWSCACADGWQTVRYLSTLPNIVLDRNDLCCNENVAVNFTLEDYVFPLKNSSHSAFLTQLYGSPSELQDHKNTTSSSLRDALTSRLPFESIGDFTNGLSTNDVNATENYTCYRIMKLDFILMCTVRFHNYTLPDAVTVNTASAQLLPPLTALAVFLVLVAAIIVLILWKRSVVQAWIYVKVGVRILDKKAAADREDKGSKPFDTFISFSQKDVGFVVNTLVPALEEKRYRVCVHYRDFPVGGDICTIVQRAIRYSSRTILLVSPHFLKSNWCRFEFQTAHRHVLQKGCHRLIIVVLGDLPPGDIDPDLRTQMKTKTYLKADDPWFWEKLYFTLPDTSGRKENDEDDGGDDAELKGMEILSREIGDDDVILEEKPAADEDQERARMERDNEAFDDDKAHDNDNVVVIQEDMFRLEPWWGDVAEA